MLRLLKNLGKNEGGQTVVALAIALTLICGCAALAVDLGAGYLAKEQVQKAADLAALSAASDLPNKTRASVTAVNIAEQNGMREQDVTVTSPYKGDSTLLEVVCTKTVKYTFAKVLGFEDVTVSARAVASSGGNVGAFGYSVFSGDPSYTFSMTGSNSIIGGGVHSNGSAFIAGELLRIDGVLEAGNSISIYGSNVMVSGGVQGSQLNIDGSGLEISGRNASAADYIEMPDFSDLIREEAETAGSVYHGSQTFNGCGINVNSPIYIDGDLTINGDGFNGNGVVLVSGDITFNGSGVSSASNAVCFYSANGNIQINGDNATLSGMLYAPNGSIIFNGSEQTVDGRVIGNQVVFRGNSYTIGGDGTNITGLPKSGVKLVE